jgi:hypothetical protein
MRKKNKTSKVNSLTAAEAVLDAYKTTLGAAILSESDDACELRIDLRETSIYRDCSSKTILNPDIYDFVDDVLDLFDHRKNLTVSFHFPEGMLAEEKAKIMTIFKAHYANAYIDLRIRLQKERILAALFLFIGFIFLGIHITFAAIKANSIYAEILDILGWVLVWEAGSVVFVNSIDDAAESHKLTLLFQAKTDEVSEAQSAPKAK